MVVIIITFVSEFCASYLSFILCLGLVDRLEIHIETEHVISSSGDEASEPWKLRRLRSRVDASHYPLINTDQCISTSSTHPK
jgi:hypothetical protein